jgi:mycobactin polyketide synthetase MbtD
VAAEAAPEGQRAETLELDVRDTLGQVMGVANTESVDGSVPLIALGLDSLLALDFRKRVKARLNREVPLDAIMGGASLDDVVLLIAR